MKTPFTRFLLPLLPAVVVFFESFPPEIKADGPLTLFCFAIPWFLIHYLIQGILINAVYWVWCQFDGNRRRWTAFGLVLVVSLGLSHLVAYFIPAELPLSFLRPFTHQSFTLYLYSFEIVSLLMTALAIVPPARDFIQSMR